MRKRFGVSHSEPSVSLTRTRYRSASLALRIPPATLSPTGRPQKSAKSLIASAMTKATGRVAAGEILPVEVLTKSAPAAIAMSEARLHTVVGTELTGLQDDLEMSVAAGFLGGRHLGVDGVVVAGQQRPPADHGVDL